MNTLRQRRLPALALLACALVFAACSGESEEPEPVVETNPGATAQVMVVFAPRQLGDNGYADRVMSGIQQVEQQSTAVFADTLDVDFISEQSFALTQSAMRYWAANTSNPLYGNKYKRRLLVLTEQYMIAWLDDIKDLLQPDDEVLVLKAVEEDLNEVAALEPGNRLHTLNISAADAARKYSHFILSKMDENRWSLDEAGEVMQIWTFRLFPDYETVYRDSIYEALTEELDDSGEMFDYIDRYASSMSTEGLLSADDPEESAMQAAYDAAENMMYLSNVGFGFCYVDLGAANMGYDYFLLNQGQDDYYSLMLDAKPNFLGRFVVERLFDKALSQWVGQWLTQETGSMPPATEHGQWDGYCKDTVPEIGD